MSEYVDLSNKSGAEPKKAYMHFCREYEMRSYEGNSPDDLVGSLPLRDRDFQAVNVNQGDEIILYVESNDENSTVKRPTQSKGRAVTLPVDERRKLGLGAEDKIRYWIQNPSDYEMKKYQQHENDEKDTLDANEENNSTTSTEEDEINVPV